MTQKTNFPGRKQARQTYWLLACFFVLFLIPTFGFFVVYIHNPAGIVVGGFGSALWTVMLSLCLVNVVAAYSTVTLDGVGLTRTGPFGSRSVEWERLRTVSLGEQSTGAIRLHLDRGRPLLLRLDLIEDGQELGRIVRERLSVRSNSVVQGDHIFRLANLALSTFLFGSLGAFTIALAAYECATSPHPSILADLLVGIPILIFVVGVVKELSRYARITNDDLIFGDAFRAKRIPLSTVETVETGERADSPIRFWAQGSTYVLPTRLDNPDQLLASLRARTLSAVPEVFRSNETPSNLPLDYGPNWGYLAQFVWMAFMFLLFSGMGPYIVYHDRRQMALIMGSASTLLFGFMFSMSIWMLLYGSAHYKIDGRFLVKEGLWKPWKISLDEVSAAWRRGLNLSTYRLIVGGRTVDIDLSPIKNCDHFVQEVSRRTPSFEPLKLARVFTVRRDVRAIFPIGLVLVLAGFWSPDVVGRVTLCVCGALAVAAGYVLTKKKFEVREHGLLCHQWNGSRYVPFSEVQRLEIDYMNGGNTSIRRIRLEHPAGGIEITSQIEDFVLLEIHVRSQVRPELIHDATEPVSISRMSSDLIEENPKIAATSEIIAQERAGKAT